MVLRKSEPTWAEGKKQLGDPNFLVQLVNYDKDQLNDAVLNKVSKWTKDPELDPEVVGAVSRAAKSLCMWVRAMEVYGRIAKEVAPKRAKLQAAMKTLSQKQAQLAAAQAKVKEISDKVLALREKYTENVNNKDALKKESEDLEVKLERASNLVGGLGVERARWESSIEVLDAALLNLVGDCLLAAAFLSYCGPFDSEYRSRLLDDNWAKSVKTLQIPTSAEVRAPPDPPRRRAHDHPISPRSRPRSHRASPDPPRSRPRSQCASPDPRSSTSRSSSRTTRTCATGTSRACPPTPSRLRMACW